jgi:hypothetical protein
MRKITNSEQNRFSSGCPDPWAGMDPDEERNERKL